MCNYCEYDRDDYIRAIEKHGHIVLQPETAELRIRYYGNRSYVSINYCPMCGRNLKESDKSDKS